MKNEEFDNSRAALQRDDDERVDPLD